MTTSTQSTSGPLFDAHSSVLTADGIAKSYRRGMWPLAHRQQILRDVNLSLKPGEVVGLVGENGSGKSTPMKILVGELTADAGTVTRFGALGYCPQQPVVYERLTCDEHVELFARAYGMTHEAERHARQHLYDALGFERYAGTRADRLSGGTLAKLNLTLAVLADPPVVLLDEPYAGFDWDTYMKFWDLMDRRRRDGRSVLVVSHFVTDESRFDRVLKLCDGRLCEEECDAQEGSR